MSRQKHIEGHYYPSFHTAWGGFSEELFHYTSRYYGVTEAFLRGLTESPQFIMSGYQAAKLSDLQRPVMASVLTYAPTQDSGLAVISIVERVLDRDTGVDELLLERYPAISLDELPSAAEAGHAVAPRPLDVTPLEPWLNLAERLLMPVAVRDHHVEVDMHVLARHLDSPSPTIRSNLQKAIMDLHDAGYMLRNHPHLTHAEAHDIGDEGAA
jgi:hypothetical protein